MGWLLAHPCQKKRTFQAQVSSSKAATDSFLGIAVTAVALAKLATGCFLMAERAFLEASFECEPAVFLNQNTRRREPWIIRGPPPTTPAVVPTAVAVPLPKVDVILPKFPLLSLPTGLEKLVWLKRLKKSASKRRCSLSVPKENSFAVEKFQFCKPGP